jgi:hypothetical protein
MIPACAMHDADARLSALRQACARKWQNGSFRSNNNFRKNNE